LMAPCEPLPPLARWDLLRRLERHLLRTSYPRIQVFLLVLLTGAVGLLTSTVLLHLQVRIMALRYFVSVAVAYGAFLVFVWLWILSQQRRWKGIVRNGGPRRAKVRELGARTVEQGSFGAIDWLDLDTDLLPIVLAVTGILSIAFFVWYVISVIALAPELLAEVFLDGVLSAALYRRLRRIERGHWIKTVFARTRAPFLWALLFFAFIGVLAQHYAPEATSIGGVVIHITGHLR
jgi:hypothetical protein